MTRYSQDVFDRALFCEDGYTTAGMAVALLLTLSLIFSGAQVYRVSSASAAIQDVADASALAAENQVGQFMVVVRVCDALVLSMSLTGLATTGIGVAALCTPFTAELGETLIQAGKTIINARNTFSKTAAKSLNTIQKALPFLAAASAWSVAQKNNSTVTGSNYLALAMLVPGTGNDITIDDDDEAQDVQDAVDESAQDIKEAGAQAEQAATQANESKERAFRADCGDNPAYCMYERAHTLAGLTGGLYTNVDLWSFGAALDRARNYYEKRYQIEQPENNSTEEVARSALRKNLFRYAISLMEEAYVYESETEFDAYFPLLPKNTAEMRETDLYTESVYPITSDGETSTMHATVDCPNAAGYLSLGSVEELEEGDFVTCEECGFTASSLGSVASASSNISNGFEYHYRIVADAAEDYQKAREEMEPAANEVEDTTESLFDQIKNALKQAAAYRIDAEPAGRLGVIVLVVDMSQQTSDMGFESAFVQSQSTLGTRAAVSGATLLADASDDQNSVITQILDGIADENNAAAGAFSVVLGLWSSLLHAYGEGQDALKSGVKDAVNSIPFASQSGLGTWASKKFTSLMEDIGLQAAELDALKPVIVNTGLVAKEDDGGFAVRYLQVKNATLAVMGGTEMFSSVVSEMRQDLSNEISGEIELATIEPLGSWGPSIPITITLPTYAQEAAGGLISQIADTIQGVLPRMESEGTWR